jgi:hypothetical protein
MPQLLRTGGPTWLRGPNAGGNLVGLARGATRHCGHRTRESRGSEAAGVQPGDEARTEQRLENRCGTGEVPGMVFGGGAQGNRSGNIEAEEPRPDDAPTETMASHGRQRPGGDPTAPRK